jgi:hypothetical protein
MATLLRKPGEPGFLYSKISLFRLWLDWKLKNIIISEGLLEHSDIFSEFPKFTQTLVVETFNTKLFL